MLWDHSNKWKRKHTSFWWKPLRTSHKMPHSFTLIVLPSWKWTFPEGLGGGRCHTSGNSGGVGGHQFPAKMENPVGWGGPKWNSICGGGLDIFWNYTINILYFIVQWWFFWPFFFSHGILFLMSPLFFNIWFGWRPGRNSNRCLLLIFLWGERGNRLIASEKLIKFWLLWLIQYRLNT